MKSALAYLGAAIAYGCAISIALVAWTVFHGAGP